MDYLAVFVVGLLTGALNIFAGGGSLITIPLLILLGVPAVTANGTVRLGIITQNINATLAFRKKNLLPWREALFLTFPAVMGSLLGSKLVISMQDEVFARLLSIALITSLIFMQAKNTRWFQRRFTINNVLLRKILLFVAFFAIGIYGGAIQAGVGFIIIFALNFLTDDDINRINAIKCFIVLFFTLPAFVVFTLSGKVVWGYALVLAAGSSLGAWAAVHMSVKKGEGFVRLIITAATVVFAVKLLFF